jgi:cellulose synthase/poly-beta-1,6-N-acetylglucosamine synthase-like glycosyltransferase
VASPLISITVCVRNGAHWIDDCMAALCAQTYRPLEIIAVDDGSTDGGREKLLSWDDSSAVRSESNGIPVRVLTQQPLGLSAGRNFALNEAVGEWVAITDIDCRPEPDWIEQMEKSSSGAEAVTGQAIFDSGKTAVSRLRADIIAEKYAGRKDEVTLANGPCSMFIRENLIQRGGFDPAWYHAEDMEVSMKILQSGGVIRYVPNAIVNHVAEESLIIFLSKRRRDARAHVRIMRTYRGAKHDFTGKMLTLLLRPLMYAAITILIAIDATNSLETNLFYRFSGFLPLILILSFPKVRIILLWGYALYIGVAQGWLDAVFARNGHHRIFTKPKK